MKRLLGVLMLALVAVGCSNQPQQQYQGYETQAGYQQPDHSWFYYWMAYHATMGMYQPSVTYHVYVPPAGYPVTYRPWQAREYVRAPNGQFVRQPQVTPPPRPAQGATPARTSGGFTPKPAQPAQSRTTGGFTAKPAPPPPTTRSSGGFSKPASAPSSSRSSGGFSSSRKK